MLQMRDTRIQFSKHMPVTAGSVVPEEGIALVYVKDSSGITTVRPSTGAAGEILAGESLSRNVAPGVLPNVETGTVPAGLAVTLARVPLAGQWLAYTNGTVTPSALVAISGGVVEFDASLAGAKYSIQYNYTPTVVEARSVLGDAPVGGLASTALGIIGVLQNCTIGTNFFDMSVDWSQALFAKLGPNGTFTAAAEADPARLLNVVVQNTPNSTDPYLVISLTVA